MQFNETEISCGVKQISGVSRFGKRGTRDWYDGCAIHTLTKARAKEQIQNYIRQEIGRRGEIGNGGGARRDSARIGFFFSDVYGNIATQGGRGLAAYLETMGEVTQTGSFINYNTGRKIAMWTFVPSTDFMRRTLRE
jgi:hypothetical protein